MRIPWRWMFVALVLFAGCEESGAPDDDLEAVAPVEVDGEDPGTRTVAAEGDPDVAALEARVAELERELHQHQGGDPAHEPGRAPAGGTQVAAVPDGVDAPDDDHGGDHADHGGDDADSDSASDSDSDSASASDSDSASASDSDSDSDSDSRSASRRRRSDDPSLLGTLLGDDGSRDRGRRHRRRRDDGDDGDDGALPNPVDLLLGR